MRLSRIGIGVGVGIVIGIAEAFDLARLPPRKKKNLVIHKTKAFDPQMTQINAD